ncbi:MAG: DUF3291 domain-containing protein [Acidobacteriota bacterium]
MYQLAQVNIARMRAGTGELSMAGLVTRIDETNALAEASLGFVWRLPGSQITPDDLRVFEGYFEPFDEQRLFYNLSVWSSVDDLRKYVFGSQHAELLRGRQAWIAAFERPHLAMWWVRGGSMPSVAESAVRLKAMERDGPTAFAFTFAKVFDPPA